MTSIPASRRAAATTFAPRSWPSRPGFATSTRIGRDSVMGRPLRGRESRPAESSTSATDTYLTVRRRVVNGGSGRRLRRPWTSTPSARRHMIRRVAATRPSPVGSRRGRRTRRPCGCHPGRTTYVIRRVGATRASPPLGVVAANRAIQIPSYLAPRTRGNRDFRATSSIPPAATVGGRFHPKTLALTIRPTSASIPARRAPYTTGGDRTARRSRRDHASRCRPSAAGQRIEAPSVPDQRTIGRRPPVARQKASHHPVAIGSMPHEHAAGPSARANCWSVRASSAGWAKNPNDVATLMTASNLAVHSRGSARMSPRRTAGSPRARRTGGSSMPEQMR